MRLFIYKILFIFFAVCITSCSFDLTKTPEQVDSAIVIAFDSDVLEIDSFFLAFVPTDIEGLLPVLYILQGSGADPWGWAQGVDLQEAADEFNIIIISVGTGGPPWNQGYAGPYVDYVLEIVEIVDQNLNTLKSRHSRAICGISMGGMGALHIAAKHTEIFASASSMSGGFTQGDGVVLSDLRGLNLLIDCGFDDAGYPAHESLHESLEAAEIPHTFTGYAGDHTWSYWGTYYYNHFGFHTNYFNKHR